jgi:23S rRNA pseudouridine1911/1915/1917 synthase
MEERITVEVEKGDEGERIDRFLTFRLEKFSRSAISKLLNSGAILLNGEKVNSSHKTVKGEIYTIDPPEPEPMEAKPENIPLKIVYEDDDIAIIDKQAGLVVHPGRGHFTGTLVNGLLYHCKNLSGIGGVLRPGIVHRLDKDTSGLIAIAKNDKAHASLSDQLKSREMGREYLAVVKGQVKKPEGTINMPIGRHPTYRKKMSVKSNSPREAVTKYMVLEVFDGHTFMKVRLKTGRTHQIRVHFSAVGHPILGDSAYGKQKTDLIGRPALHAERLTLIHPSTNKKMAFKAEAPADFLKLLATLRGEVE